MKTKTNSNFTTLLPIIAATLAGMSQKELSAVAKTAGVPVGKSRKNTVDNVIGAVQSGTIRVKAEVSIHLPPAEGELYGGTKIAVRKLRTYKDPKWIVAPVVAPAS
jgi:hypothetical protein